MLRNKLKDWPTLAMVAASALLACHGASSVPPPDDPLPTYRFVQGEAEPDAQVSGRLVREGDCFYLVAPPSYRNWVKFPSGISHFDPKKRTIRVGKTTLALGQWIVANGAERKAPTPSACQGDVVYLGTLIHAVRPQGEPHRNPIRAADRQPPPALRKRPP